MKDWPAISGGQTAEPMQSPEKLRPGERLFALLLVVFAGFVFSEAYGISGLEGLTTGGVMPMLASGVMVLSSLCILGDTLRTPRDREAGPLGAIVYLFPLPVVVFSGLVAAYAALIPSAGFLVASGGFLFAAIWGLWRKGPIWALLLASGAITAIYVLFRLVFQVVLPIGSLWQ